MEASSRSSAAEIGCCKNLCSSQMRVLAVVIEAIGAVPALVAVTGRSIAPSPAGAAVLSCDWSNGNPRPVVGCSKAGGL